MIVTPMVGFCNCSIFRCTLLYVYFSFATMLMGRGELVALLCFVFLVYRDCCMTLSNDAICLCVVCDCGIS